MMIYPTNWNQMGILDWLPANGKVTFLCTWSRDGASALHPTCIPFHAQLDDGKSLMEVGIECLYTKINKGVGNGVSATTESLSNG
jgi:hypothetical protein